MPTFTLGEPGAAPAHGGGTSFSLDDAPAASSSTTTTRTTTPPPSGPGRTIAGGAGAATLGALGLVTAGRLGGTQGVWNGWNMGVTAYDMATGRADPKRAAAQIGLDLAFQGTPTGKALSTVRGRLASGAIQLVTGAFYDAAKAVGEGRPAHLWNVDQRVADFANGYMSRWVSDSARASYAWLTQAQSARTARVTAKTDAYTRAGVTPRASEALDSRALAGAEDVASSMSFMGSGASRAFEDQRLQELEHAPMSIIRRLSPAAHIGRGSKTEAGKIAATAVMSSFQELRDANRQTFAEWNAKAPREPVVPTAALRTAIGRELAVDHWTPGATMGGVGRMGRNLPATDVYEVSPTGGNPPPAGFGGARGQQAAATPPPGAQAVPRGAVPPSPDAPRLPPPEWLATLPARRTPGGLGPADGEPVITEGEYVGYPLAFREPEDVILDAIKAEKIPLDVARHIQQVAGERTGNPMTTTRGMSQKRWSRIYKAVSTDMEAFFDTPEAGPLGEDLNRIKGQYKANNARWKADALAGMLHAAGGSPERVLTIAFEPGNLTATKEFHDAVDPGIFRQAAQGYMDAQYRKWTQRGIGDRVIAFNADAYVNELRKLDETGQLDLILGPEHADEMRNYMQVVTDQKQVRGITGRSSGTAERVGRTAGMTALASIPVQIANGAFRSAATTGLGAAAMPWMLNQILFSPTGRQALIAGATHPVAQALERAPTAAAPLAAAAGTPGGQDTVARLLQALGPQ